MFDLIKTKANINIGTVNVYVNKQQDEPILILTTIINQSKYIIMDLTFQVGGQQYQTQLGAISPSTGLPVQVTNISNPSYQSSDEGVFSVDASGVLTAINAGQAQLTVTADIAYLGNGGENLTVNKSATVSITVTSQGPVEEPELDITFTPVV